MTETSDLPASFEAMEAAMIAVASKHHLDLDKNETGKIFTRVKDKNLVKIRIIWYLLHHSILFLDKMQ